MGDETMVEILCADGLEATPYGDAIATHNGMLYLWQLADNELVQQFRGTAGSVQRLAFSPDGRSIVSGHLDSTAIVWNVPKLKRPAAAKQGKIQNDE